MGGPLLIENQSWLFTVCHFYLLL